MASPSKNSNLDIAPIPRDYYDLNPMKHDPVLLISDSPETWSESLKTALKDCDINRVAHPDEAWDRIHQTPPCLVILDLASPLQAPGLAFLRQLRQSDRNPHTPVIVTSSSGSEELRIAAFEAGADDFCGLPLSERELRIRISNRLSRRPYSPQEDILRCGQVQLNLTTREAVIAEQSVPLTPMEFTILTLFVRNPRQVLSRSRILDEVWKDCHVSLRTVDAHIALLRRKLPPSDYEVLTIYGSGYALRPTAYHEGSSIVAANSV